MKKRVLRWALAIAVLVPFLLIAVSAAEPTTIDSGYCGGDGNGTNLIWTLTSDGMLSISGTGAMADFARNTLPWASYRNSIQVVTIQEGVTSVGGQAFEKCSSLTTITLPSSVTRIGQYAFYNCSSLKAITFPANLTSIGIYAFCGCAGLTTVSIPDTVTELGMHAFNGCAELSAVDLPESITSIGEFTFAGCSMLTEISIPRTVTSIGRAAFAQCSGLTTLTIPDLVTEIGWRAFVDCSGLSEIIFEGSAPAIDETAFEGLFSSVSATAFYPNNNGSWNADTLLNYGGTLTWVGYDITLASGYCGGDGDGTNLTWTLYSDGEMVISGSGPMTEWTSASEVAWYAERTNIKTVIIEPGVTTVGSFAFCNCEAVSSVTIPEGVASIGKAAFQNCKALTALPVPSTVTAIESYAFAICPALTTVTIPEGVITLGEYAFRRCEGLTVVTIPSTATKIAGNAFVDCTALEEILVVEANPAYCDVDGVLFSKDKSVLVRYPAAKGEEYTVPSTVVAIGQEAFSTCFALTSVIIPEGVVTIGINAFYNCDSITNMTLPDRLETMDVQAFGYCDALATMTIPESVTTIKVGAFRGCNKLSAVYYTGDAAAWNAISIGFDNESLTSAQRYYAFGIAVGVVTNGNVTVGKSYGYGGDTITVTATPAEGYCLDKIYVNGEAIEGNTFTMPDEAVTVTAEFKKPPQSTWGCFSLEVVKTIIVNGEEVDICRWVWTPA